VYKIAASTNLPSIGTITGTPPDCQLAVLTTACKGEEVIEYTLHEEPETEMMAEGQIRVAITDRHTRLFDSTVPLHPGETRTISINAEACRDKVSRLDVVSSTGGLYAERIEDIEWGAGSGGDSGAIDHRPNVTPYQFPVMPADLVD
jgi:hypothetical protein